MDSGKAFDKPLPSVDVLKKFQVSLQMRRDNASKAPPSLTLESHARLGSSSSIA